MIVLDRKGYESKKLNFGLPDMTGYCDKKREASSHHYDLTIEASVNATKKMSASFTAKERSNPNHQFFVYICDCFGDIQNAKSGLKIDLSIQVLAEGTSDYSLSPSFKILHKRVLPIAFLAYGLLLGIIFFFKREKFNLASTFEYPFIFLMCTIGMQLIAILFLYF